MKYEDLSFTTVDENGVELINDIVSIVPNSSNPEEPFVVFTDYSLDDNDEFIKKYAKLVEDESGNFALDTNLSEIEKARISDLLKDEIVQYVNDSIEVTLHE